MSDLSVVISLLWDGVPGHSMTLLPPPMIVLTSPQEASQAVCWAVSKQHAKSQA